MDDRQTKITEGAGLQESRLNTEFIDWLNKWGSTILMVVLLAALSWIGWQWWQRHQVQSLDRAFEAYDTALVAGKPDNLLIVADEHKGKGAIFELATLRAADSYLQAARSGVVPGGNPTAEADLATPEQIKGYLEQAGALYGRIVEHAKRNPEALHHGLYARSGLAAVAITQREADRAKQVLGELIAEAKANQFNDLARWTETRLARVDQLMDQPGLHPEDDIFAAWGDPEPAQPETEGEGDEGFTFPQLGGDDEAPAPAPAQGPGVGEPEPTPPPGS